MTEESKTPRAENGEELVTAHTFFYRHEALLAKNHLERNGLECFLPDENVGFHAMATGGARLQVRKGDLAEARSLLDSLDLENGNKKDPGD